MIQRLYSAAEAAEYLGVSTRRVYQLLAEGRLGQRVTPRSWAITAADLRRFAQRPRKTGRPREK